jgi:uncharacterized protein (TIGR03118 family)
MKNYPALAMAASLALAAASLASAQNYTQVNLVANAGGAPVTDAHLVNPWGISRGSGSPWWVADAGTGLSTLYNGVGTVPPLVVTIPPSQTGKTGSPSGTIYNGSATDFLLTPGHAAAFLFCTLDGTIAGWNAAVGIPSGGSPPSTHAVTMVKTTDGSVYTGMTAAPIGAKTYLYVANFTKARIDVFSNAFKHVTLGPVSNGDTFNPGTEAPFFDALLPAGYSPYNVQAVGRDLVVTFAPSNFTGGPGKGFVDVFTAQGELLVRLQHGDWMNAPWGVALAPNDFGTYSHDLLIGMFGEGSSENSGTIAAFNMLNGRYLGQVEDAAGKPIVIDGLWALSAGNGSAAGSYDPSGEPAAEIYFAAGPNKEQDGLFGYLKPVATELTQGNDQ